jgi:hypothetical protein
MKKNDRELLGIERLFIASLDAAELQGALADSMVYNLIKHISCQANRHKAQTRSITPVHAAIAFAPEV